MAELRINQDQISDNAKVIAICPFGAIQEKEESLIITAECRMCMLCVKNGPPGAFVLVEKTREKANLELWKNIIIFAEINNGSIHPVTYELIGKAKKLVSKVAQKIIVLLIGSELEVSINRIKEYGVDKIIAYSDTGLKEYMIEPYTAVFEDLVKYEKPGIILIGGTVTGRNLAPRVAARLRTGLTADCTQLDIQQNNDLDQIRPAFGGNIMAHIRTSGGRPQMATVRYKVFNKPEKIENADCIVEYREVVPAMLHSRMKIIEITDKELGIKIEDAEVIVAVGNGIRKKEDLQMIFQLAEVLKAQVAGTRLVIEKGWIDPRRQIGLSGRTVRPQLIITCGISGSVQFVAGMQGAETIIAINKDENAPIFKIAHHGFVGDLYILLPLVLHEIISNRGPKCIISL
jgi:electron transfer flavoprotein alpha subunit